LSAITCSAYAAEDSLVYRDAMAYLKEGQADWAFLKFKHIVEMYPESKYADEALFRVGEHYFKIEEYYNAGEALKKYFQLYPESSFKNRVTNYLRKLYGRRILDRAYDYYEQEKWYEALNAYKEALDLYPKEASINERITLCKERIGDLLLKKASNLYKEKDWVAALSAYTDAAEYVSEPNFITEKINECQEIIDFEKQQAERGLVKYEDRWVTPDEIKGLEVVQVSGVSYKGEIQHKEKEIIISDEQAGEVQIQPPTSAPKTEKFRFQIYNPKFLIINSIIICFLILIGLSKNIPLYIHVYKDYNFARGTQHLKQIQHSISVLNRRIKDREKEKRSLNQQIDDLKNNRSKELSKALTKHIVETRLKEVRGIGQNLYSAIIYNCFDGTLQSLKYAYGKVYGIGDEKQFAISAWVNAVQRQFPTLLQRDFPRKNEINTQYDAQDRKVRENLKKVTHILTEMYDIRKISITEAEKLKNVKIYDFLKAYNKNSQVTKKVNEYLLGAFPEWGNVPNWFKTLITEYGD